MVTKKKSKVVIAKELIIGDIKANGVITRMFALHLYMKATGEPRGYGADSAVSSALAELRKENVIKTVEPGMYVLIKNNESDGRDSEA